MLSVYICYPTCPVIAMAHHLCLRHLLGQIFRQAILAFEEIGFVLGLFFWGRKVVHFHNPL